MEKHYTGVITKEDDWLIARCLELDVTTQGKTVEEAQKNLLEAVELYIESFPEEELPAPAQGVLVYPMEVAKSA